MTRQVTPHPDAGSSSTMKLDKKVGRCSPPADYTWKGKINLVKIYFTITFCERLLVRTT